MRSEPELSSSSHSVLLNVSMYCCAAPDRRRTDRSVAMDIEAHDDLRRGADTSIHLARAPFLRHPFLNLLRVRAEARTQRGVRARANAARAGQLREHWIRNRRRLFRHN